MSRRASLRDKPQPLTAAMVRAVVRALERILAEIAGGAAFPITRLTRVKRLCTDEAAAAAFATFIAEQSLLQLDQRPRPDTVPAEHWSHLVALAREGLARLEEFQADRSPATERALRMQCQALYQAQNEHQGVPFGQARVIVCWEAMQVETALACLLATRPEERARYGYELASDFVKRYDPFVSGDLNRASVEPLAAVIGFWHAYAERLAAAEQARDEDRH